MTSDLVMLTPREAHKLTNLPIRTIYRMVENGEIAARKSGKSIYIRRKSLINWIEGREDEQWPDEDEGGKVLSMRGRTGTSGSRSSVSAEGRSVAMPEQRPRRRQSVANSPEKAVPV